MIFAHLRRDGVDITLSTLAAGNLCIRMKIRYNIRDWDILLVYTSGELIFSKKKANRGPGGPEIERFSLKIDAARSVEFVSA